VTLVPSLNIVRAHYVQAEFAHGEKYEATPETNQDLTPQKEKVSKTVECAN